MFYLILHLTNCKGFIISTCLLLHKFHETITMLEHVIWNNLKLCSQASITHIWLQDKLSLIPFEGRAVFLCQHHMCTWLQADKQILLFGPLLGNGSERGKEEMGPVGFCVGRGYEWSKLTGPLLLQLSFTPPLQPPFGPTLYICSVPLVARLHKAMGETFRSRH